MGARRTDRLEALANKIEAAGGAARAHSLDVTSRENFKIVTNAIIEEFGHIDVIVNNAGIMPLSPLNTLKTDEWERMIDVNIKGVLNGIEAVVPHMENRDQGHVINTASNGIASCENKEQIISIIIER